MRSHFGVYPVVNASGHANVDGVLMDDEIVVVAIDEQESP